MIKEALESINASYLFIAAALIAFISFLVLKKTERKIENKETIQHNIVSFNYIESLENIKSKKTNEEKLAELNNIFKKYLDEDYQIPYSLDNSERISILKSKNMLNEGAICNSLQNLMYSGEKLTDSSVNQLIEKTRNLLYKDKRSRTISSTIQPKLSENPIYSKVRNNLDKKYDIKAIQKEITPKKETPKIEPKISNHIITSKEKSIKKSPIINYKKEKISIPKVKKFRDNANVESFDSLDRIKHTLSNKKIGALN
jgi:hypothetical protein